MNTKARELKSVKKKKKKVVLENEIDGILVHISRLG